MRGRRSGGCGSEDAEEGYILFRWRIRLPTTFGGIIPSSIQRKNEPSSDGDAAVAEVIGSLGLCYLAKIRVERGDRIAHVPTGSGELKAGLLHAILRQLGLTIRDL